MKTADLYFNVNSPKREVIISGEYPGGTWRISYSNENDSWALHLMPRHTRGFLSADEYESLIAALREAGNL